MILSLIPILMVALQSAQSVPAPPPAGLSFQATLDSIKVTARPGQIVTRQFTLTLDANQRPTHFKARVEDWWRSEDGARSFYGQAGTLRRSCARWVSLNPMESALKASETLTIRISASLPADLPSGGYWCALTVDEVPDPLDNPPGVGVRFVASVSTGIFIYVEPVKRAATITEVLLSTNEALVKVSNDGDAPLGIEGRLEFFALNGFRLLTTAIIPRSTVLPEPTPQGTLRATLPSATVLPSGRYRVRAILDFGVDHYIGAEREITLIREGAPDAGRR